MELQQPTHVNVPSGRPEDGKTITMSIQELLNHRMRVVKNLKDTAEQGRKHRAKKARRKKEKSMLKRFNRR